MDKQQNSNSKQRVIKYFLIISAVVFGVNLLALWIFGYPFFYYDGLGLFFLFLKSFNLFSAIPFVSYIYYSIFSFILGWLPYYIGVIFHFIIGLGVNGVITYMIVNKGSNSNDESISNNVLTVQNIIKNSFKIAQNNIAVILLASILWILTIWIPYLNVGTTIGMWALVVGLSKKDTTFYATSIFESKYRKYMGEIFLLLSFITLGVSVGYMFFIIPGLVISFAWGQAIYLLIDKGLTPLQAIKVSNDITYGEKITIFLGYISIMLILGLLIGLIGLLIALTEVLVLVAIFSFCASIFSFVVMVASSIYIYGELSNKLINE